ncbi:hypothetical protein PNEG_02130 [Pneumocystis murina B123]|uniref:HMG box domain-containing protein n=1 Tax=Pneumocystis murina (strain B123) TaxID=1069680 RepID=M7P6N5_PNEMU|nr:hypothetical protein PNEG_02130 [Pneumocystis murina B123]EMR09545.1 hypothetical protein PNEG_02130 [Pneumocystis murina B123]
MISTNFIISIGFSTKTLGYRGIRAVFKRCLGGMIPINKEYIIQWTNTRRNKKNLFYDFHRFNSSKSTSRSTKANQELKALPTPSRMGYSPWIAFIKEKFKQMTGNGKEIMKQCSSIWKNMSQEERQTYKDISSESRLQASRTYMNWINSLSPKEIMKENHIRNQLRKQGKKGITFIKDPRKPKRPLSAFLFFCAYARSSPDFIEKYTEGTTKITEQTKILAKKWALMDDFEKQEFINSSINDKERYQKELEIYYKL